MDIVLLPSDNTGKQHAADTKRIQAAIDTCFNSGGGRIIISEGKFRIGTIYLRSNIEIHLSWNSILIGSDRIEDYTDDVHRQLYRNEEHMDRCLFFCENGENIAITGKGYIDGQGAKFAVISPDGSSSSRPMLFRFINSTNICLEGITFRNPASWTHAFINCEDIKIHGIDIKSRANENGDGLDFDGCRRVIVSNSKFDCSDDCICLQNSSEELVCSDVAITNCQFRSQWAGIRIGLLSCGDIESVAVSNCIFRDINCSAIKIQSSEGGIIRDLVFSNLIMNSVQRPVFMTINHYRERINRSESVPETGAIKSVQFNNIRATGKKNGDPGTSCIILDGLANQEISDIRFNGLQWTSVGDTFTEDLLHRPVPEHGEKRAEAFNYGGPLPAASIFARHINGLHLSDIMLDSQPSDNRPPTYFINCKVVK